MKKLFKLGLMLVGGFVLLLVGIVVLAAMGGSRGTDSTADVDNTKADTTAADTTKTDTTKADTAAKVPTEYISALAQAKIYSSSMSMSKKAVYDQLVSPAGGKFTEPAGQYAVDNIKADWNANALASAKIYQSSMSMSPSAIRDQLVSPVGGKFTAEEADYAIANLK